MPRISEVTIRFVMSSLCAFMGINIDAQELSVKSFEMLMEPMTVPMQKKDLNGFICPLVKIQLPIQGAKFEGNIVEVKFDVNEYYVYLSPNSKMVAVKCPGYKTLKVHFNDYNIPKIVSKTIYLMDLEATQTGQTALLADSGLSDDNDSGEIKSGDEEMWIVYFNETAKAGFCNSNGDVFIPAQFDDAKSFSEGLACVKKGGKWGFIDRTGEIAIPCAYSDVSPFKGGNAIADAIVDEDGKRKTMHCLIDYTGKELTSFYDKIDYFHDDRALIVSNGKYGFVDREGVEVIPPVYEKALYYKDGYAEIKYNGKWGVIDLSGKEVINAEYDDLDPSDYKLVAVCKNEKWGYLNMKGEQITKFEFDDAEGFDGCEYAFVGKNDRCGLIDTSGKIIIPIKYDDLDFLEVQNGEEFSNTNLLIVNKNDKEGIIDLKNKTIVPIKYDGLDGLESNGLIRATIGDKWGYINRKGEVIIDIKYEAADDFEEGIGFVKKNGKWGAVNTKGEVVIPFIYDSGKKKLHQDDKLFVISLNGKWGCLNTKGGVQIPFIYDEINYFHKGRARVKKGNDEFMINENGKKISEVHPTNKFWY